MIKLKKILLILILLIGLTVPILAEKDFRDVNWGMTMEEVKESENERIIYESDNILIYQEDIKQGEYYLMYNFTDGRLTDTAYSYNKEKASWYSINEGFRDLNAILLDKYNKPILNKKGGIAKDIWEGDVYEDDDWIEYINTDLLYFLKMWKLDNMYVTLFHKKDQLTVWYFDREFAKEEGLKGKIEEDIDKL